MFRSNLIARVPVATLALLFTLLSPVEAQQRLDHRDDFRMNSISGGDFRDYISAQVTEDDRWAHALRLFGTFHNHMHEMMTDLALHGKERLGHDDHIPEIENRVSGGEWREYRRNMEEAGIESSWRSLVQITELMHDRVHHAMYKSTVYDRVSRARVVDLDEYIGPERAPYPPGETVVAAEQLTVEFVPMERFRQFAWHSEFEDRHFHAAMQKMMVFDEMLYLLLSEWAEYGADQSAAACRPAWVGPRITRVEWHEFSTRVEACPEEEWRHFVRVTALMHDRIHHMMYRAMIHYASVHGREGEIRELLGAAGPGR